MLSGHGHGAPTPADPLLTAALHRAIPAALACLADLPADARAKQFEQWHADAVEHLTKRGDVVRYGGRDVADIFVRLVRGLAVLAYAPGGVTAFGHHWCTDHNVCDQAAREATERLRVAA
jgi:hypothetical protein